jgi:triacylglycerol lipase
MNALGYALLAQESYKAEPDIGSAFSSSRAICRQTEDGFCVTFRGSDNTASWVTDLDIAVLDDTKIGKVHKGFWQAWQTIAGGVKAACAASQSPITLCGHSLGAALALIGAADFICSGIPLKAIYAFEPPRVSPSPNVCAILAKVPVFAYRNGGDPVPDVPPFWRQLPNIQQLGKADLFDIDIPDHLIENVITALGG